MVYLDPLRNETNQYNEIQYRTLLSIGPVKQFSLLSSYKYEKDDIVILNWFENGLVNVNGRVSLKGMLRMLFLFITCALKRYNLIWVKHNRFPHAIKKTWLNITLTNIFLKAYEHFSTRIVVHSKSEVLTEKYIYIPHPLYELNSIGFFEEENSFFVFGALKKYKKIEELITEWPGNVSLHIYGKGDERYVDSLKVLAKGKEIFFNNIFLDDEQVIKLFCQYKNCIISHMDDSAIVSGVFFMAKTFGNNILLNNKRDLDVADFGNNLGVYKYSSFNLKFIIEECMNSHSSRTSIYEESLMTNGHALIVEQWSYLVNSLERQAKKDRS